MAGNCVPVLSNHKPPMSCCQSASYSRKLPLHQVVQCDAGNSLDKIHSLQEVFRPCRDRTNVRMGKRALNLFILSCSFLSHKNSSRSLDLIRKRHLGYNGSWTLKQNRKRVEETGPVKSIRPTSATDVYLDQSQRDSASGKE